MVLLARTKKDATHLHYFPTFDDRGRQVDQTLTGFTYELEKILALFGMYKKLTVSVR